jgi:uncharacterized membrane protein required for colicin V production
MAGLRRPETEFAFHQHIVWGVVAGAGTIVLLGLVLGSLPVKIACVIVGLTTLQGLWRGAAEVVGIVAGLLIAAVLAGPVGRGLEGVVSSIIGTTGLTNRVASMAIVAVVIVGAIGVLGSWFARRKLKERPKWKIWDRYAGAGLGLAEGCLLAMLILWGVSALEPVARTRSMSEQEELALLRGDAPDTAPSAPARASLSELVIEFSDDTRKSFLGPVVRATNPLPDTRLLALAGDFAAISQDEEALGELLSSEAMVAIDQMQSVQSAMERIKADPELATLFDAGGVTPQALRAFFDSPTMLDILDNTSVIDDVSPLAARLEKAVRDAKSSLDARKRGGG